MQEHLDFEINLDFRVDGNVYMPMQVLRSEMTNKIINCLESKGISSIDNYKKTIDM